MPTKYVFVTGGVVSGLGKGITAASLGRLLKARGYKVTMQKFDPYINIDPGTMNPIQHGEVFVTDDGAETDLDLGHYERFIDESLTKNSNVTTGKIYWSVLQKERRGDFGGGTVQVIPHITNEIKNRFYRNNTSSDTHIAIIEVGGTVGDIESQPFLEAIRQFQNDVGNENAILIHVTLIPYLKASGITKIDFLILTHGDYDHMGDAITLIEKFKIENVIFNVGDYNELESRLIKKLKKKNIPYYQNVEYLNFGQMKLNFLNTKIYDNENDNSNVIYFRNKAFQFLFMGDAGINKEKDLLTMYHFNQIDFLKIGHHGSKTSSSKSFISTVNPKICFISVGKNNRYGHPDNKVLNNLNTCQIYRTDLVGNIKVTFRYNQYLLTTYSSKNT